jgi:hypothetical protein
VSAFHFSAPIGIEVLPAPVEGTIVESPGGRRVVHHAARRDDVASCWRSCWPASSPIASCRCRRCPRSIIRRSRSHALSRRQPRCDEPDRHCAAGAPVRPDGGPVAHVVRLVGGRVGRSRSSSTSTSRSTSPSRKCRPRSTRPIPAAGRSAGAANLRQGQSGRRAVLSLGVTSATRRWPRCRISSTQRIANKISQISGVGLVSLSGGQRPAVRIQANVQALAARMAFARSVAQRDRGRQRQRRQGSFDGPTRSWSIDANDQLATAATTRI